MDIDFLRADASRSAWRSPLARALSQAPTGIRDVSAEAHDGPLGVAAGIAGLEIEGPFARTLLSRLAEIEPPAVGAFAHVRAQLTVEGENRYRIWFAQEYADYVAHAVLDAWEGLV